MRYILKLLVVFILTLLPCQCIYASWLPLTQEFSDEYILTTDKKEIYIRPNSKGRIIGEAEKGCYIYAEKYDKNWYKIIDGGYVGYLSKKRTIKGERVYDYLASHQTIVPYKIVTTEEYLKYYKDKKLKKFRGIVDTSVLADKFLYGWIRISVDDKNYYISSEGIELIPIFNGITWRK